MHVYRLLQECVERCDLTLVHLPGARSCENEYQSVSQRTTPARAVQFLRSHLRQPYQACCWRVIGVNTGWHVGSHELLQERGHLTSGTRNCREILLDIRKSLYICHSPVHNADRAQPSFDTANILWMPQLSLIGGPGGLG